MALVYTRAMDTNQKVLLAITTNDLYVPDEEFALPSPIPAGYWTWHTPDNMGLALMCGDRFIDFILGSDSLPDDLDVIETLNEDHPMSRKEFIAAYLGD